MGYQTPYTFVRRMAVLFVILGSLVCSLYVAFVHAEVQNIADRFSWPVKDRSVFRPNGGYEFNISGTGHFHPGLDWNYESGDRDLGLPVLSVANGVVEYAGPVTGNPYGNVVMIRHTLPDQSQVWSFFAHLNSYSVSKGQSVQIHDQIGTIGKTGCTPCNSHMHWEVRIRPSQPEDWPSGLPSSQLVEMYVDPEEFINNFNFYSRFSDGVVLFSNTYFRGDNKIAYIGFTSLQGSSLDNTSESIVVPSGITANVYDRADGKLSATEGYAQISSSKANLSTVEFTSGDNASNGISALFVDLQQCTLPSVSASSLQAATLGSSCNPNPAPAPGSQPLPPYNGTDTTPPRISAFNVSVSGAQAFLSVSASDLGGSGILDISYSARVFCIVFTCLVIYNSYIKYMYLPIHIQ